MANDETVEVDGDLAHETDLAYLIKVGTYEVWVPKSLVEFEPDQTAGTTGVFQMPLWLAEREGLA